MSYFDPVARYLHSEEDSLDDGQFIQTDWLDMSDYDKYQVEGYGSSAGSGFTFRIESSSSVGGSGTTLTSDTVTNNQFWLTNLICRQRYMRFTWTNNSGGTVSDAYLAIKGFIGASDKLSVFPVNVQPSDFSQAALVQAILRGRDPDGNYINAQVNEAGALVTGDFGTEVARGAYSGYSIDTKFGRNPDVDATSTPEDMWNGGAEYTGFNAASNENLETLSSNANDTGTLVSSGSATGGSSTTLVDSGATFVTDGVATGDLVINDTQEFHGFVLSATETTLTVSQWYDGPISNHTFSSGDSYRVATAGSTGAAVVRWANPLNSNYEDQGAEYVILNGTTGVTSTGDFFRLSRGSVVLAGSSGLNEGTITARQATTTANVFCVMPEFGQTTIGAFTVPAGKKCLIKRFSTGIVRASGAAGSATIILYTRQNGHGAFQSKRVFEVSTSTRVDECLEGGILIPPRTDIKVTIYQVSDNNTVADCQIEYYFIDE